MEFLADFFLLTRNLNHVIGSVNIYRGSLTVMINDNVKPNVNDNISSNQIIILQQPKATSTILIIKTTIIAKIIVITVI